jgi:hypothetical protein
VARRTAEANERRRVGPAVREGRSSERSEMRRPDGTDARDKHYCCHIPTFKIVCFYTLDNLDDTFSLRNAMSSILCGVSSKIQTPEAKSDYNAGS